MKFNGNNIKIEKTARYFVNEIKGKILKNVWIVIHGYAQLAEEFLAEFEFLDDDSALIVAPEGLSKFYFRNKIGASWMTKEDRFNEIEDYLNFLEKLVNQLKNKFDLSDAKFNLLGFSQGVHTATRFFINSGQKFDNLFLCSSDFPKDADFEKLKTKLEYSNMYFIYGLKDEIVKQERYSESVELLNKSNIDFSIVTFNGGHKIDRESILKLLTK